MNISREGLSSTRGKLVRTVGSLRRRPFRADRRAFAAMSSGSLVGILWRLRFASASLLLFTLLAASCKVAETSSAVKPQQLAVLFEKLQSGDSTPDIQAVVVGTHKVPRTDPNWPTLSYLIGEAHLKRKDIEQARATFRDLAVWAVR